MVMRRSHKSYKQVVKSANPLAHDSKANNSSSTNGLFGKGLIVFVCLMIIGYLIADIICGFKIGQFLPDVLTTSWFAFWAVELVNLVVIKRSKIRAQFPDLIETVPDSVNSLNVNLRSKDEFGTFNEEVQKASESQPLENPLPVVDDCTDDAIEYVDNVGYDITQEDKGGNSQCLNLIY